MADDAINTTSGSLSEHELELALENWGRWCFEKAAQGHCMSIEHRWRSPQQWYDLGEPKAPSLPIDPLLALAVNRAWRVMPHPYKAVLSEWYVLRRNPVRTCRALAIARSAHDEYIRIARIMCMNILTRQARMPYKAVQHVG